MNEEQFQPVWLSRGKVDEVLFSLEFIQEHYLVCQKGVFYSLDGRITDEEALKRDIYKKLREHVRSGLGSKVESILSTLRMECPGFSPTQEGEEQFCIYPANGCYNICQDHFDSLKNITRFRLPVAYNPDTPKPERWLRFLSELLYEEDIPTLQQYMGYCLMPTTRAQKMLIITGKGGEGKSRIGVVMKALLGENMTLNSIAKIEGSPFARADLEHNLLMVDDDLRMEALKQTNYLKSIITAELPMDLERKGIQSYQGRLFVRFLAFGNDTLQSLHDRSHGFFRRQIILTARERPRDRKDDPFLGDHLAMEAEGILLWCIEGLKQLWVQDFQFTVSSRARRNLLESMTRGNNAEEFMRSQGYFQKDPQGAISSKLLYDIYRDWCQDNAMIPLAQNSFISFLGQNTERFGLQFSKHISAGNGKQVRGFRGIRAMSRF